MAADEAAVAVSTSRSTARWFPARTTTRTVTNSALEIVAFFMVGTPQVTHGALYFILQSKSSAASEALVEGVRCEKAAAADFFTVEGQEFHHGT